MRARVFKSSDFFVYFQQIPFRKWKEIGVILLLLSICTIFTFQKLVNNQESFSFYQNEFAPAVMFACGYNFVNQEGNQQITDFLDKKSDTVHCYNINHETVSPLTAFQHAEKYLILSTGILWKMLGIQWNKIIPLFLILYSATMVAIYNLFRLVMRGGFSFLLTLIIAISPLQQYYLLQFRDYSVAPFLLWTVWISAILVMHNTSIRKRIFLSAVAGSLIGLGLGFRTDLMVLIPYFIATLLFFAKKEVSLILGKVFPLGVFFLFLLSTGYPIVHLSSKYGGNLAHVIILGLANEFTANLSLLQPKVYSLIPAYRDLISYSVINSFAERMFDVDYLLSSPGKEYEHYGNLFLFNYLYSYPADFLIRIYASICEIIALPFQMHLPAGRFISKIAIVIPFFSLILIAFYQLRFALFVLFSLIYLCSYPVLQFDLRHYFYLDFIGFWFLGLLCEYVFSFLGKKNKALYIQNIKSIIKTHWKMVLSCVIAFSLLSYGLIFGARIYQTASLIKLYTNYLTLPSKVLTTKQDLDSTRFKIALPTKIKKYTTNSLETSYLKVMTKDCSTNPIVINLHYMEKPALNWNAPDDIKIPGGKKGAYFFPIYNFHNSGPAIINEGALPSHWINSISYSLSVNDCIESISTVNTKDTVPFLLYLNLQEGWETNKLYETF